MKYILLSLLLITVNSFAQSFDLERGYGLCETHKLKSGICVLTCTGSGNGSGVGILRVSGEDCRGD